MHRPRILLLSLISTLMLALLALGLSLDIRSSLVASRAPIPASTLAAFRPGNPIWADTPEALPPTATPRPTESYPPPSVWYSSVVTVPLPIPSEEVLIAGEWLSNTRLQVKTGWAQSSGLYWIDFRSGKPVVSTPQSVPTTLQAYSASSVYSLQCGNPLQMMDAANQAVISQTDPILNPSAVIHCSGYVSWAGDEVAAFAARADGEWGTYLWRPDGSTPLRVGAALNGARPPPGRRTKSDLHI